MIHALDVPTLLKVVVLTTALQAFGWVVLGLVYRVSRLAAVYYFAANIVFLLSLMLGAMRAETANLLTVHVGSLLSMISAMLLRLGLLRHIRLRPPWREMGGHVVIVLLLSSMAPPTVASLPFFVVLGSVSIMVSLTRACIEIYGPMRSEFGRPAALLVEAPFVAAVLLIAFGRVPPALPEILAPSGPAVSLVATPRFLILTLVTLLLFNFNVMGIGIGRLVARVRRLAERDVLTGLWNRRAIESRIARERARLARSGDGFALVMLDLDHFKRINDTWGHAAGDAALRHAAQLALHALRAPDSLGRYGGEEFVALLPATSLDGAHILAERVRQDIAEHPLEWEGHVISLTTSAGVVATSDAEIPNETLLRRADEALFRAKNAGRNRVVVDTGDPAAA